MERFKVGDIILSKILSKNWVELRELPNCENSEQSYIRLRDIERVFFVERLSDDYIDILVFALNQTFLYNTVETMQEAILVSKNW